MQETSRCQQDWFQIGTPNVTNWTQALASVLVDYGYALDGQVIFTPRNCNSFDLLTFPHTTGPSLLPARP